MAPQDSKSNEPIAIIGSGCRFPGESSTPSKLWEVLRDPPDIQKEIPENRFNVDGFYHPDNMHHGTSDVRHSYFLAEDHRVFDAQFFGIKPVEAHSIDPQQRLLLETVYESVEAAGLSINELQGSQTAVYVGLMCADYADLLGRDTNYFPTYFASGTARSIMSNRISYFFDWHGPSMTIDTACSSSLVAVHQAVQLLRSGESRVAVAAGANLLLGPEQYIAESKLKMLSPNGRSRMWDEKADGYARGDGIASVVLKTLTAALEDGDHIESIIRETAINQDGKTKGITMPSVKAQAALIQDTYKKAGLDLGRRCDRPQYFEAHGTGTPAGDPVEAEAVSTAFFGPQAKFNKDPGPKSQNPDTLFVGSIKTVIGHTEGTAGLAAVLKASLALQNGVVPPNRLFDKLSPAVKPFYDSLEILTAARPWPALEQNAPRRVSVNSFGFGGANAHAILESYAPATLTLPPPADAPVFTPFNFSAASERSLLTTIATYSAYLKAHKSINLRDLSWTLNTRRSKFPFRTTFSALNVDNLCSKLDAFVEGKGEKAIVNTFRSNPASSEPRVLGIFTGQGAQWARMGAELVISPAVQKVLRSLEQSLADLPADRPSWSLQEELLASSESSRVGEAALSQPLCTAVQIILVDLLKSAGIKFAAVIGHSSGEIGAAYAAGYLSAHDAIRIAYYRGFHLRLAQGTKGQAGAMIAVGTSFEDAQEVCQLRKFKGRICAAASNSGASVTISGDADAIEEVRFVFEEEKRFARLLKVDKAYHSHHMAACSEAYVQSLQACGIKVQRQADSKCSWISSVYQEDINDVTENLNDAYWNSNLVSPVRFSQAVEYAIGEKGQFDIAIEVGPHPALKGPTTQIIQDILGDKILYTGVLKRGANDIEAMADSLGFIWSTLEKSAVDFTGYDQMAVASGRAPKILKNLPTYSWDHERIFWHESNISKAFRGRADPTHELLGAKCHDDSDQQVRWRNLLSPKEIPWLTGHQVQGQMVFPAAGYISTAIEAAREIAGKAPVRLIELQNLIIGQALVFDEDSSVETVAALTDIQRQGETLVAKFSFFSVASIESGPMSLNADGRLQITFGEPVEDILPPRPQQDFAMMKVESDRFYTSFAEFGYGYTGPFRALSSLERKLGVATGLILTPASTNSAKKLMMHPATVDAAIQSILLAYCFPGDSRLRSIQLPTGIERIIVNPSLCIANADQGLSLHFNSTISKDHMAEIDGDVDVYPPNGRNAMLQLEGMHTTPLVPATAATDLLIFSEAVWDFASPNAKSLLVEETEENYDLGFALERVAYFYLRNLQMVTTPEDRENCEWHHKKLFAYVDHMVSRVASGKHPFAKQEWINDTHDEILAIIRSHPNSIDLRIMHAVGENMPAVIRGELTMLEPMIQDNMLNDFYVQALGMSPYLLKLTRMASQIGHRHPHMRVLEIGAGTGGATKAILKQLDGAFSSYTFTDISTGFFEKAKEVFAQESKLTFKALDIEKNIVDQGYTEYSFDVVIASLVLHATSKLEETMKNVRRLLKPGGYLLLLEITDNDPMRFGFIFGGLPGWWLGADDGRSFSPCVGPAEWGALMKKTGFSGIDTIIPHHESLPLPLSVIVSQALDDRVNFLRTPLTLPQPDLRIQQLAIIGGNTPRTAHYVAELKALLNPHCGNITHFKSLVDLNTKEISFAGSVLCMQDLDKSIFHSMTTEKLNGFQKLFEKSKNVLWVMHGYKECDPYAKMVVGFGRTLILEMVHLRLQFIDINQAEEPDVADLAETMLRFVATDVWEDQGRSNDIFWSIEPEMAIEKGEYLVPRLKLSRSLNNRYNSSRRLITKEMNPKKSPVKISHSGAAYVASDETGLLPLQEMKFVGDIEIQVSHSTLNSVRIGSTDYLFLVLGTNTMTGDQVIALSTSRGSLINVSKYWTSVYRFSTGEGIQYLLTMFYHLIALAVLFELSSGDLLVVFEPNESIATILTALAAKRGIRLTYVTTSSHVNDDLWVSIHPHASKRYIEAKLPSTISRFVIWENHSVAAQIATHTRAFCKVETLDRLMRKEGHFSLSTSNTYIAEVLENSRMQLLDSPFLIGREEVLLVPVSEIQNVSTMSRTVSLVDWTASPTVLVQVEPVDAKPLFKNDKTYWLVGLTGGLGLSLCRWMIAHGARFIVISSRNPKVDPRWLKSFQAVGATVKIHFNDVTNRDSLRSVYKQICNTLPPIAGVCHGAMVLHDTMFLDLDMGTVQKVLKPKVDGSIYLDEIFAETKLDFFVFLSSMASITGNPGQSAYGAANMFLAGLAAQRRKRGLAASTVYVGAIVGNGYVTRELSLTQQLFLRKVGNLWMSEQDFHQIFAEAVVSSPCRPGPNPEFSTGLQILYAGEDEKITWFKNPLFSHLVFQRETASLGSSSTTTTTVSVKNQLLRATTPDEVYEILKVSFIARLQNTLQTDSDVDMVNQSADALGIDSLVAVDVRSWFLKELTVDMPVLKILSGATIGELLDRAQKLLPLTFIPNVSGDARSTSEVTLPEKPEVQRVPRTQSKPKADDTDATEQSFSEEIPDENMMISPEGLASESSHPKEKSITSPKRKSSLSIQSIPHSSSTRGTNSEVNDASPVSSISSFEEITKPTAAESSVQRVVPMSFGQSRFWFLKFYLKDQTTFNVTTSIHLEGSLRVDVLAQAVASVGQRHESLRTRFFTDENHQGMQSILESSILRLERKDISDSSEITKEYTRLKEHVYDLEKGETMRIILLSLSPTSHQILLGYHHINMDGVSFEIFFSDLQKAYNLSPTIRSPVLQYPDFTLRQRKEYFSGKWTRELSFWRKEYPNNPPPLPLLPLSTSTSRQTLTSYGSHLVSHRVSSDMSARIQETCKRLKVSSFQFYLTVYKALILRFLDIDDLCIGIADANRNESDVLQSLGCYLNLLPIRFKGRDTQIFTDAVKETKSKTTLAFANSKVPFDVLLNELNVPRSSSQSPLFQVFLNYRQGISESRTFCGCDCEWTEFDGGQIAYDLSVDIVDNAGGDALIRMSVQKELYTVEHGEILMKSYVNLLDAFSRNPATRLSRPPLYSPVETKKAIEIGRGPFCPSEWHGTLLHRIDLMVRMYCESVAMKDGLGNSLTYNELAARADLISAILSDSNIGEGSRVGVFQEPSTDWVCSMVAILRLGAVYVPLDPRVTSKRLAIIVNDCLPSLILVDTSNELEFLALESQAKMINVSTLSTPVSKITSTPNVANAEGTMVILYTSGSTGKPKGIFMKHSLLRNHVETAANLWLSKTQKETVLQQASFSFDMSLAQIFWPLCTGGTLYIASRATRGDPIALSKIISSERISVTGATPSEYISWLRFGDAKALQNSEWRLGLCGGERAIPSLRQVFRALGKPDLRLFNCYGPTEVTLCSHVSEISYAKDDAEWDRTTSALAPWPNYAAYIVDSNLKPVPVGVPGEVVIGGAGIASGYLNLKELSNQQFLPDTFASPEFTAQGWTLMHRTGDRGRLRGDGSLTLEGRILGDTQVKLQGGLRVDLQDVEATIIQATDGRVLHAVASVRSSNESGTEFLVAHIEFSPDKSLPNRASFLKQLLHQLPVPQYMRPAMIIPLDKMPVTTSHKLDRISVGALPLPQTQQDNTDSQLSETETRLRQLWEEVLTKDLSDHFVIDSKADFFQVGGSSLLLVSLQALIAKTFNCDLPLVELFDVSTLGRMAARIESKAQTSENGLNQGSSKVPQSLGSSPTTVRQPDVPIVENLEQDLINWDDEVRLPSDLSHITFLGANVPKVVALTGSTGFLGRAILSRLVEDKTIRKIHCIGVRQNLNQLPPLFASSKVAVHAGDQSLPRLGLSEKEATNIFAGADAVIHNGADVSFLKTYQSLKPVNVESTKELAKLSLIHGLQFHYISTASVTYLSGKTSYGEVSVGQYQPPRNGSNGYIATKWASERYLEQMSERFGMPLVIHRPSSVTGEGASDLDVMSNLLKYSRLMKTIPVSEFMRGIFDFVAVETVAAEIIDTVSEGIWTPSTKYVFESGELQIPTDDMVAAMEKESGEKYVALDVVEWVSKAQDKGLNPLVAMYLNKMATTGMLMPRLVKERDTPNSSLSASNSSQQMLTMGSCG
ncbi:hypothetical protein MMC22_001138 [Lobaria immixta]|nr:hypothetical protein [Lobaria immixta]